MRHDPLTLRSVLDGSVSDRALSALSGTVSLSSEQTSSDCGRFAELRGRNVLLDVSEQLTAASTMIGLDGVAARMVVCAPGLPREHRDAIAEKAAIDVIVDDAWIAGASGGKPAPIVTTTDETEWLLLTSGTTGVPKLVSHTLRGLAGAITHAPGNAAPSSPPVWATFYDIRRYGGLQIFLRAIFGAGSMVLPGADEPLAKFLQRCGRHGVTHISGTPSHWRRVLMNPAASAIAPSYVRLSGEIADQAILDALQHHYPQAKVGHAYASTEAGVGFEVNDGKEGFPATFLDGTGPVAMKVEDDTLRIRSARTASDYIGEQAALRDTEGYVDTGDIVLQRCDRYYFAGRRGGIINIGGQKVHPEEIEAVINRHRAVRMSLVKSRKNPIVGAVVAADVVLRDDGRSGDSDDVRREIEASCRDALAAWKVPATIRFVPALDMTAAGKLSRSHA